MNTKYTRIYLIPLFLYILIIKFALAGSFIKTIGQLSSIGIILSLLVIIPLWPVLKHDFSELNWKSLLYIPSLIIAQLIVFFVISLIVTHMGHGNMAMHSTNQAHLDGMGTYAAKNKLTGIVFFFFVALFGPMVENILFLHLIQGTILTFLTKRLNKRLGITIRIIATTVLFTLWHITHISDLTHPMFYEYLSLIWLAIVYEYCHHNLVKPWFAHAGLNTLSALIMLGI